MKKYNELQISNLTKLPEEIKKEKCFCFYGTTKESQSKVPLYYNKENNTIYVVNKKHTPQFYNYVEILEIYNNIDKIDIYNCNVIGIGYYFTKNSRYACIDLDKCIENGIINPIIDKMFNVTSIKNDYYIEYSVSGKGLHIIVNKDYNKELYTKYSKIKFKDLDKNKICDSFSIDSSNNFPENSGVDYLYYRSCLGFTGNQLGEIPPIVLNLSCFTPAYSELCKQLDSLKAKKSIRNLHNVDYSSINYNSMNNFDIIKQSISLKTIANYYNKEINRSGECVSCPFPSHKDNNPSFSYCLDSNLYKCFSACEGGSVIEYIMHMENFTHKMQVINFCIKEFKLPLKLQTKDRVIDTSDYKKTGKKQVLPFHCDFDYVKTLVKKPEIIAELLNENYTTTKIAPFKYSLKKCPICLNDSNNHCWIEADKLYTYCYHEGEKTKMDLIDLYRLKVNTDFINSIRYFSYVLKEKGYEVFPPKFKNLKKELIKSS